MRDIRDLSWAETKELEQFAKDLCKANCFKCEPLKEKCMAYDFACNGYLKGYRQLNKGD